MPDRVLFLALPLIALALAALLMLPDGAMMDGAPRVSVLESQPEPDRGSEPAAAFDGAIETDGYASVSETEAETRITGRLFHQDGATPWAEDSRIYVYRLDAPAKADAPMKATPVMIGRSSCGAFSMKIEPGRYQLRTESVRPGQTTVGRCPSFEIEQGEERWLDVVMGGVSRITGELAWEDGRGMHDIRVLVRPMLDDRADGTIVLSSETWTDRSGRFCLDLPYPMPVEHAVIVSPMVPVELRNDVVLDPAGFIRQEWGRPFVFRARKKIPELRSAHVAFDYRGVPVPIKTKVEVFVPAGLATLDAAQQGKTAVAEPEREVRTELPNVTAEILLDGEVLAVVPHVLVTGQNQIGFQAPLRGDFVLRLKGPDGTLCAPLRPDGMVLKGTGARWTPLAR